MEIRTDRMVTDYASMHRERMSNARDVDGFSDALAKVRGSNLGDRVSGRKKAPYSHLAKDGVINYNGVTFICDNEKQRICLGDVSDPKNCITVGLSGGGSLCVNRDNLGDLSKAIGMFSPEDVNRIMRAIAQDTKCQQMQQELDDEKNNVAEISDSSKNAEKEEE